jgi:hypothetical protein
MVQILMCLPVKGDERKIGAASCFAEDRDTLKKNFSPQEPEAICECRQVMAGFGAEQNRASGLQACRKMGHKRFRGLCVGPPPPPSFLRHVKPQLERAHGGGKTQHADSRRTFGNFSVVDKQ